MTNTKQAAIEMDKRQANDIVYRNGRWMTWPEFKRLCTNLEISWYTENYEYYGRTKQGKVERFK